MGLESMSIGAKYILFRSVECFRLSVPGFTASVVTFTLSAYFYSMVTSFSYSLALSLCIGSFAGSNVDRD